MPQILLGLGVFKTLESMGGNSSTGGERLLATASWGVVFASAFSWGIEEFEAGSLSRGGFLSDSAASPFFW
jgi:hypothetical protein